MKPKPVPLSRTFNNVQTDFQWRQRCQKEEMQLLDSFAGPKAHQINNLVQIRNKQRLYARNGAQIMQIKPVSDEKNTTENPLDAQSLAKLSNFKSNTATSVSNVSKTHSKVSYNSQATSTSTRLKLTELQKELEMEKKRRVEAEEIIEFLRSTGQIKLD